MAVDVTVTVELSPAEQAALERLSSLVLTQADTLTCISKLLSRLIMADNADLQAAVQELKDAIVADQAADQAFVEQQAAKIAELEAQIAAGSDTSATIAELKALQSLIVPAVPTTGGETPVPPTP